MANTAVGSLQDLGAHKIGCIFLAVTFTSITCLMTLQTLLAMAAHEDWTVHQVNVIGAYLRGDLSKEIYLDPPEGTHTREGDKCIWRLCRPLYSLKRAGRQWKIKLGEVME